METLSTQEVQAVEGGVAPLIYIGLAAIDGIAWAWAAKANRWF